MALIKKKNKIIDSDDSVYINSDINVTTENANDRSIGMELRLTDDISMMINIGNCQDQGARSYQEDSFGYTNIIDSDVISQKGFMAILSDGMGGLNNGKEVADYVVQNSISMFEKFVPMRQVGNQLKAIINASNEYVCSRYSVNGVSSAGATAVLAYIYKNRLYWATAGDSRIYCLRNKNMIQLNEDHDYKNKLYRDFLDGLIQLSDAENDEQKDSLVSFVGKSGLENIEASIKGIRIRPGDIFVLCSDGIYNGISQESMREILLSNDPQTASENIVQSVVNAGYPGQDNMTVIVIKCSLKN